METVICKQIYPKTQSLQLFGARQLNCCTICSYTVALKCKTTTKSYLVEYGKIKNINLRPSNHCTTSVPGNTAASIELNN